MQRLANAAIEGLMMCNGTTIVSVNDSLAELAGGSGRHDRHRHRQVAAERRRARTSAGPSGHCDRDRFAQRKGELSPVELILRPIDFGGRPHQAIAVRDLTARREAERHIRFLALHDALTALPNRADVQRADSISRLPRRAERQADLAVLYLDLDRFKEVNDLYGHATGDRVLQTVASRVTAELADGQTDGAARRRRVRDSRSEHRRPGRIGASRRPHSGCAFDRPRRRDHRQRSRSASALRSTPTTPPNAKRC